MSLGMPRRKQDKPQHLEEETRMDEAGCVKANRDANTSTIKEHEPPLTAADNNLTAGSAEIDSNLSTEDYSSEAAVITNSDWMSLKATVSSIQQQMHVMRLQQFQILQLLSAKSHMLSQNGLSDHKTSAFYGSSPSTSTATKNVKDGENPHLKVSKTSPDPYEDIHDDGVDSSEQTMASADELTFDRDKTEDEPEENDMDDSVGEGSNFDCAQSAAVLSSDDLLKSPRPSQEHSSKSINPTDKASTSVSSKLDNHLLEEFNGSLSVQSTPFTPVLSNMNTEDNLEEYMEIHKPENTHLELAKNMDGAVKDSNQCLICKRILSCKSALMMHYRTHTGERPFKCKLCSRAFTTKGNLKTHMGVHRAKPPLRQLHSCPVCNKQFSNALVLNQHIKMHADDSFRSNRMESMSGLMNEDSRRDQLSLDSSVKSDIAEATAGTEALKKTELLSSVAPGFSFPFDFGMLPSMHGHLRYAEAFARQWEHLNPFAMFNQLTANPTGMLMPGLSLTPPNSLRMPLIDQTNHRLPSQEKPDHSTQEADAGISVPSKSFLNVKVEDTSNLLSSHVPEDKAADEVNGVSDSPKSEKSWNSNETGSSNVDPKIRPPSGTTCDLCAKAFACRSALEIHYRSHTKQRPFKCDICGKAFTTRGNMKQHILTHKTDDIHFVRYKKSPTLGVTKVLDLDQSFSLEDIKRSNNKHQCTVCLKHFSSASAVQIHLRTHTGDRPFECSICGKAFTTKGNLKVHMGTHMWHSTPSSRETLCVTGNETSSVGDNTDSPNDQKANNNSLAWKSLNSRALLKASLLGNTALIRSYPLMMPGVSLSSQEEGGFHWL